VGDSHIDFETARNAGARICLARYGLGWIDFPRGRFEGSELFIDRSVTCSR
jgi:hypothetical protein